MNDPEVVKFLNEHTRRAADKLAAAYLEAVAHLAGFAAISNKVPNDGTVIEDGREGEGVSSVTCAEMRAIVGVIQSVQTALDANSGALRNLVFKVSVQKGS
jgi:hypothetical protein